jgi:hypothetical protein
MLTLMIIYGAALAQEPLIPKPYIDSLVKKYSKDEIEAIEADLVSIRSLVFYGHQKPSPGKKPIYIASAGGPLSRKTTILEKIIQENPRYKDSVYLDPDQRSLKFMAHTYISRSLNNYKIYESKDLQKIRRDAYLLWREGSNYITNTLLNEAYEKNYDIAHGTTLTGPASPSLLDKLKKKNYEIILLLSFASDDFKKNALDFRNEKQGFYQVTEEDFIEKAKLFPQRFQDYVKYADRIDFFLSEKISDPIENPIAVWSANLGLHVENKKSLEIIKYQYQEFLKKNPQNPTWEVLFQKKS